MNIAFFTARHLLGSAASDSRYVYEAIAPHFHVDIFSEPDAALCRGADVVFTRFPLPINRPFLRALEPYSDKLVINNPTAQLIHTKRHLLSFPSLTAPTIISTAYDDMVEFAMVHGTVVCKPLDRHKGVGVTKVDVRSRSDDELRAFFAGYLAEFGVPVIQRYIPEVMTVGDKRVNVIGFQPVSAVVTMPAPHSFICHESVGGTAHAATLTNRDMEIIDAVVPFLRERRIFWAAIDIIGPYLGEINVLTPAMVLRADRAHHSAEGANAIVRALKEYERGGATW